MRYGWLLGLVLIGSATLPALAQPGPAPVALRASDGIEISGLYYRAPRPKGIILLFHQAGSSKAEYATIAPKLVNAGFSALAIDQRSGGSLFGPNETAARVRHGASYIKAKSDLVAALGWAKSTHLPVVLWGSSYSAALVFEVAAEHPGESALLAFSPGEYLGGGKPVAVGASRIRVPIYVTSSSDAQEIQAAGAILAASPSSSKTQYVPRIGVHGASTLIPARDPKGAAANWDHVLAFLSSLPLTPR